MVTKNERLQAAWHRYEKIRKHAATGTREAVRWAVHEGLLDLPRIDPYEVLAAQMAAALREETALNDRGQRYRVNHAVRITKGGVQHTLWAEMGLAPHEHMEKAFAQRREQIIGDCVQLKIDVDTYNRLKPQDRPSVQLILDFTEDVAERELAA
jgi:hypothetical protein